jgi:hypothetical protein
MDVFQLYCIFRRKKAVAKISHLICLISALQILQIQNILMSYLYYVCSSVAAQNFSVRILQKVKVISKGTILKGSIRTIQKIHSGIFFNLQQILFS